MMFEDPQDHENVRGGKNAIGQWKTCTVKSFNEMTADQKRSFMANDLTLPNKNIVWTSIIIDGLYVTETKHKYQTNWYLYRINSSLDGYPEPIARTNQGKKYPSIESWLREVSARRKNSQMKYVEKLEKKLRDAVKEVDMWDEIEGSLQ